MPKSRRPRTFAQSVILLSILLCLVCLWGYDYRPILLRYLQSDASLSIQRSEQVLGQVDSVLLSLRPGLLQKQSARDVNREYQRTLLHAGMTWGMR